MKTKAKLAELKNLQGRVDALRNELGISRPGEVTFLSSYNGTEGDTVVVEADGLGGATTSVVVGNYPVDHMIKFERFFANERKAEVAAEAIALKGAPPGEVLHEPG